MKKIITLGILSFGVLFLAGCGQQQASQTEIPKANNIAKIMSEMSSVVPGGMACGNNKKPIVSGDGDAKVCVGEDYTWPVLTACGDNASDTKWIVKNGAGTNWDFTLDCKGFTDCNGPQNAICNATTGCKFSGSCQLQKGM